MATVSPDAPLPALAEDQVIQLFGELRAPLIRFLVSSGLPAAEGEEVVQETFLGLFRLLRQGKSRENLRAWVFKVARNLAFRSHRSRQRKPEDLFAPGQFPGTEPVDLQPNPEEHALDNNGRERMMTVFDSFPGQVRQTLHLRAEGLKYREIAEVLGVSITTVAGIVSRSLERLQKAYEC